MTQDTPTPLARPWYREPWPWLLMLAPGAAVVWGAATLWIAIVYRDPLVTEHAWEDGQKLQHRSTAIAPGLVQPAPALAGAAKAVTSDKP